MKIKSYNSKGKTYYEVSGYLGVIELPTGETKRKNFHKRGFSTSKEATLAYSRAQLKFDDDKKHGIQISENPTFEDVYAIWLESYKLGVKESSLNRVEGLFKHHITPSLGKRHINTITWQQCQQAVLTWRKEVKAFNKLVQYASLVFRTAQKMGVITTNPMKLVDIREDRENASPQTKSKNYWTSKQLATFLSTVVHEDNLRNDYQRSALFYLLATTGMRKGEALALTWQDVDLVNDTVTINKTTTRALDNTQTVGTPKTVNAYRTLSLEPDTVIYLKKYRQRMTVIPLANTRVFHSQKGGPMSLMTPNHWLETALKNTELHRITVHGLRHTFASIQVLNGINVKALQLQMGHSDIKITLNIYTHFSEKQVAAQVIRISDVI